MVVCVVYGHPVPDAVFGSGLNFLSRPLSPSTLAVGQVFCDLLYQFESYAIRYTRTS